jgi:hypothetical protein
MKKRKIPLSRRPGQGSLEDSPMVRLWVRSAYGEFAKLTFCIDTGDCLPPRRGQAIDCVGPGWERQQVPCVLHVRILSEDFAWPCDFLESSGPASANPYGVIGRAGFLDAFAFCIEKPVFTVRRRGSFWNRLLPPWMPMHPIDQPL